MSKYHDNNSELGKLLSGRSDKPKKRQFSFYLAEDVYDDFMAKCEEIGRPGSRIIEAFMIDFIESKTKARSK